MNNTKLKEITAGLLAGVIMATSAGCAQNNKKKDDSISIDVEYSLSSEENFNSVVRDAKLTRKFFMPNTLELKYVSEKLSNTSRFSDDGLISVPSFYSVIESVETKNGITKSKSNTNFEGEKPKTSVPMSAAYFYNPMYIVPNDQQISNVLQKICLKNHLMGYKLHKSINRTVLCDQNGSSIISYEYKVICDGDIKTSDDNGNVIKIPSGEPLILFKALYSVNYDNTYELIAANQEGLGANDFKVLSELSKVMPYTEDLIQPINESIYNELIGTDFETNSVLNNEAISIKQKKLTK